jgi:NAD(P)-dependent dehydrogenase (short-subunit alcohol dehydrogenase family)
MSQRMTANTTAVVTGAAGAIGRSITRMLHDRGDTVVAADLAEEGLARLAQELPGLRTVVADVGTAAGGQSCLDAADGVVDVLINNAGVSDGLAAVNELDDATWERVLRVNLTSAYLLMNRVVDGMVQRGGGAIVNVASIAGIRGGRGGAAYTASKFGLVGLTQNVAATLGGAGIRCNAVCPGSTTGADALRATPLAPSAEHRRLRDRDRPPAGPPETVASVVLWLLSPAAARLNGAVIPIDDGWTAY